MRNNKRFPFVLASLPMGALLLASGLSPTVAAAPAGPHVGGSITVGMSNGPWADVFNPYEPGENQSGIVTAIYEPLIEWNGNTGASKPWLATSWSWSHGNTVLTMNLRKGVTFSNGEQFTSSDVVFTLNMLKKYPAVDTTALWTYIKNVKALGANKVQITLRAPSATFLYYLGTTYMVPQSLWKNVNPVTFPDSHPVGTGPYMLKFFSPEQVTLTRNPHYWQAPKPYLQTINYPAEASNNTASLGLANGTIQWSSDFIYNLKKTFVARDPKTNHYDLESSGFIWLYPNLTRYPFNLLAVRKALSDAINRTPLYKIAYSGYSPVSTLDGIEATMAKKWATPQLTAASQPTYNPKLARKILLKAGFKVGPNGMLNTPKGKPFTVTLLTTAPYTNLVTASSEVASNLKAIGINATVTEVSPSEYGLKMQDGQYSLGLMWGPTGPNPFFTLNEIMSTAYSAPIGRPASENVERYSNPQIAALSAQYNRTTNFVVHKKVVDELANIMRTQLPAIALLNKDAPNEYSTATIAGWPTGPHPYWDNNADAPIVVLMHLYAKP